MQQKTPQTNKGFYQSFAELTESRSGIEDFLNFLSCSKSTEGHEMLKLWLTIRGYRSEFSRKSSQDVPPKFLKWNIKCYHKISLRYANLITNFSRSSDQLLLMRKTSVSAIERPEKMRLTANSVKSTMITLMAEIEAQLKANYFLEFVNSRKPFNDRVPEIPPLNSLRSTDSDTNSRCKKRPLKDAEIATKRPDIFAAKLIEKLNRLVSESAKVEILPTVLMPKISPKSGLRRKLPLSEDSYDNKVGDWLERNHTSSPQLDIMTKRVSIVKPDPKAAVATHQPKQHGHSRPAPNRHVGSSVLSSDSGLDSLKVDHGPGATSYDQIGNSEEINAIKRRLISDLESQKPVKKPTKVIYHYKKETFVIRIEEATLDHLIKKFHDQKIAKESKFFIKQKSGVWAEQTCLHRRIAVENDLVEARVV